jgi:hypothetical protein
VRRGDKGCVKLSTLFVGIKLFVFGYDQVPSIRHPRERLGGGSDWASLHFLVRFW